MKVCSPQDVKDIFVLAWAAGPDKIPMIGVLCRSCHDRMSCTYSEEGFAEYCSRGCVEIGIHSCGCNSYHAHMKDRRISNLGPFNTIDEAIAAERTIRALSVNDSVVSTERQTEESAKP